MVKELSSVANQLGRKRTLCELYGAGGWDLRFEDMKRIGDWLEVLGVNLLDEHLSYVTLRGARKADHPQSFSYHEPWWDSYHVMAGYFTRLTAAMCQGEQVNHILVIEPTTTAWMYQADPTQAAQLDQIGKTLLRPADVAGAGPGGVRHRLRGHHGAARRRSTGRTQLQGRPADLRRPSSSRRDREPSTPRRWTCWSDTRRPAAAVISLRPGAGAGRRPAVGPRREAGPKPVAGGIACGADSARAAAPGMGGVDPAIRRADGDKGILFHQRRRLDDGDLLLPGQHEHRAPDRAASSSRRPRASNSGTPSPARHWRTRSGEDGSAVVAEFELPPCGSLLLFFSKSREQAASAVAKEKTTTIQPAGPMQIRRVEPNVLTLDYMDVTAGGETRKSAYFYQANQFAFQKNGMERNPWDSAVQFKDELIRKKFPPESGFEATYRFTIEGRVPKPLWIVIERPGPVHDHLQRQAGRRRAQAGAGNKVLVARPGVRQDRHHRGRQDRRERGDDQGPAVHDLPRAGAGLRAGRFLAPADQVGLRDRAAAAA